VRKLVTRRTVLISLDLLFLLIAWNREINLLYGIFALLLSTIVISHVLPRHSISKVKVSRTLPPAAFEGDELEMSVSVENTGRTSRHMIEAVDFFPAAAPQLQNPMTFVARLPGGKKNKYSLRLECYRRGEYSVGPIRISSAYPLGLSYAENSDQSSSHSLIVYPRIFPISQLALMPRGGMSAGIDTLETTGGTEDFFGTREYREGDSLRYIHWPSSAKHSRLIVKEFEMRASTEITIIIDLHRGSDVGEGKDTTLEYAVKIAASIAKYALEQGHGVQLIGYGRRTFIISYARGMSHLARILDALARVKADGNTPYPLAITRSADLLRDGGTAVLLFSGQSTDINAYLESIGLLKAKRTKPVCVFINAESFSGGKERQRPEAQPFVREFIGIDSPVYFVSKGDRLEEIF
jgi:uncharacterized protein (DUF58 family)